MWKQLKAQYDQAMYTPYFDPGVTVGQRLRNQKN